MPVAKPPPLVPSGRFEGRRPKSQPHPIGYPSVQETGSSAAAAVDSSMSYCPDGYVMSDVQPLTCPPPGSPTVSDSSLSYFNTNSPPLLNLSPNLSPAPNMHRVSPGYDLRESTRRQSLHGRFHSLSVTYSFIHLGYFYSPYSSPLLLTGAPTYSIDDVSKLTCQSATGNYE